MEPDQCVHVKFHYRYMYMPTVKVGDFDTCNYLATGKFCMRCLRLLFCLFVFSSKIISEIQSECQTDWTQIWPDTSGPTNRA